MTIGVFDSGVGGLWILKYVREKFPQYNYVYFGDQAHVPYGSKSLNKIKDFSEEITKFLIKHDCQIIIIACNTATTASLSYLRKKFPEIKFIGIEPAVKPASKITKTSKVGVLATPATFQGELYNSIVEKFASRIKIFKDTCSGLVEQIEKGELKSKKTKLILEKALNPMIKENIDTVVLGCSHYPFVTPLIRKIIGNKINIIDSTIAIVHQVGKVLKDYNLENDLILNNQLEIYTTGDLNKLKLFLSNILGENIKIKKVNWNDNLKII